jgi:cytochrome c5
MRPRWLLALAAAVCIAGCSPKLPEPESPGAKLYAARCNSCHRVFAPSSLKFAMWKVQVERMQGEIVRHGLPPLTPDERDLLLDYLKRHSG